MTNQDYAAWTKLHADLFGLRDPRDADMFAAWAPLLIDFSIDELRAASHAIAGDAANADKIGFRANHVTMLRAAILARRADAAARERDRQEAGFAAATCPDCYGVGLVRVPDRRFVVDGVLERPYFQAVACGCPVGTAKLNAVNARLAERKEDHRLADLATYEAILPDWRLIAAAFREQRESERKAAEVAAAADRTAPIDVAAIAERLGRP